MVLNSKLISIEVHLIEMIFVILVDDVCQFIFFLVGWSDWFFSFGGRLFCKNKRAISGGRYGSLFFN